MRFLPELFENNRRWAADAKAQDPEYFARMRERQAPGYLWIGCADSRVPANEVVGLSPGELFVHRNVANLAPAHDPNVQSVLQYAVDTLAVLHVIVCGHVGCGGVLAALDDTAPPPPLDDWLAPVRAVARVHAAALDALPDPDARWRRLCELNVATQVEAVCASPVTRAARARGQHLVVHGWVYDIGDGLLHDLGLSTAGEG